MSYAIAQTSLDDNVLDLAHAMIVERGYGGFDQAELARAAGISTDTLTRHFANKTDLVLAVVRRYHASMHATLTDLSAAADPGTTLRDFVDHWTQRLRCGLDRHCVCGALMPEIDALPDSVASEVRSYFDEVSGWVSRIFHTAAARGLLRVDATPDTAASSFMTTFYGAAQAARTLGDGAGKFAVVVGHSLGHLIPLLH